MTEFQPFLASYLYFVEIVLLIAAVIITISSFDDLFVDLAYWSSRLLGTAEGKSKSLPPVDALEQLPERPIAIMVPCWKEHEVIFSMLSSNSRLMRYSHAHYFVGVYINDPLTQDEVRKAQALYKNIHMVLVPHDGPTSKADCLNQTLSEIFLFEAEQKLQFAGIVMHDSEDLIHPLELKLFNKVVDLYDFVQLPVYSFSRPVTSLIAGLYMDEFAEMHTKDLEVRQRLSGVIPCAGVSACFSREAIQHLMDRNQGEAFRTSSFTEDYDIAFRVAELGFKSAFIAYPVSYAIDINIDNGQPGIIYRSLPLATREFFPSGLEAAYRQRARWLLGIVFQGSREHGWRGSLGTKYFLVRDRKGVMTNPAVMLGYFALANLTAFEFYRSLLDPERQFTYTLLSTDWAVWLFFVNFAFLIWRLANRMIFTGMIYDLRHALMSAPRLVVGNFVNFFATWRAVRVYLSHRISGKPLVWDKTSHSYPVHVGELALPLAPASIGGPGGQTETE
ncbi:glycosyl transferase family protein [Bradyrhizobium lablabi]|uniref:glycosyl transferase family protein n=1 Tax=Bradyrhizobium lablabi TaxID=722472 RepID=UPI001BADD9C1|nr:glycosyl transferase family protein [Bradyrhizobium lablabi]MBR0697751.1 glycosyl transferase family protein [Bradyrhizobium lablabi]